MNFSFQSIPALEVARLTRRREGERKLGEGVDTVRAGESFAAALHRSDARFALVGLPEDVGVRANGGVGGARTAWRPALSSLLNMQSTAMLPGEAVLLLAELVGEGDADEMSAEPKTLREEVVRIDDEVAALAETVVASGKILLAVGGGHNNAYGAIRGGAATTGSPLGVINLDAHSDYRVVEGRHSGNPFRYAADEGWMDRYAVLGLHESYNSGAVMDDLRSSPAVLATTFEDIFLRGKQPWDGALSASIQHLAGRIAGVELDLDCIEGVLSSAATPCGISTLAARQYLHRCAGELQVAYLHLAEGAAALDDGRADWRTPKLIAYLLTDFMRASLERQRAYGQL